MKLLKRTYNMSNIAFDFLNESVLFQKAEDNYKNISLIELTQELDKYKSYIKGKKEDIEKELVDGNLKIIQSLQQHLEKPSMDEILQGSLFLDKYLIDDPLFSYNLADAELINENNRIMGFKEKTDDDLKKELSTNALYMKNLVDGVRCDTAYIKFYPFSLGFQYERIPYMRVPDLSIDDIDKNVYNWFSKKIDVINIDKQNRLNKDLSISNHIGICFKGDSDSKCNFARYQKPVNIFEVAGKKYMVINLDYIPEKAEYDNWVHQEVITTIKEKLNFFVYRHNVCSKLNSPVILNNELEKQFYEMQFSTKKSNVHTFGFDLNIPGLKKLDFKEAMEIRRSSFESFRSFQNELQKDSVLLSVINDEKKYDELMTDIQHKYDIASKNVTSKLGMIKSIASDNIINTAIAAFSYYNTPLLATGVISGLSLLDALRKGRKDYLNTIKNPFYFYKKIKQSSSES